MASKRRALPLPLRKAVWEAYVGSSINSVCFVCESAQISFGTTVEYGHVLAVANGGTDTVENLRPICSACNKSMGTQNLLEYKSALNHAKTDQTLAICAATSVVGSNVAEIGQPTADEARIFANLQVLTDAQIEILAQILGISESGARRAIARHEYTLPRATEFHRFRKPHRDDARQLIAVLSAEQLTDIFGAPNASTIDALRRHAMQMIGMI